MKNQKLLLLLLTPFIVMACDLINDENDCSTATVLRQYNSHLDLYSSIDTSDCQTTADALDSLIVFVEDNKSCVVSALEFADSTTNGNNLVEEHLNEWKAQREKYADCDTPTPFNADPCSADSITAMKDHYKMSYYNAYDSYDCAAITTALNDYISYLKENKDCIAKTSSETEVENEITTFSKALENIASSNCNSEVMEFYGLFKNRTAINDFNCNQAIAEFKKIEENYEEALDKGNCQILILYAEYLTEVYNYKSTCLIEFIMSERDLTESEAKMKLANKMNEIDANRQALIQDCDEYQ